MGGVWRAERFSFSDVCSGPEQAQRLEVDEDALIERENRNAGKDPVKLKGRREMNCIESTHGLYREWLPRSDMNLGRNLQQLPRSRRSSEHFLESRGLNPGYPSLVRGAKDSPLRLDQSENRCNDPVRRVDDAQGPKPVLVSQKPGQDSRCLPVNDLHSSRSASRILLTLPAGSLTGETGNFLFRVVAGLS